MMSDLIRNERGSFGRKVKIAPIGRDSRIGRLTAQPLASRSRAMLRR